MNNALTILIIEDNEDDFLLLREMIESSDEITTRILHADRIEQAYARAEENSIDLAIIDLQLPDSVGLDTFLIFNERFPSIPSVIMTGVKDLNMAVEAVKQGAQDYLHKGEISTSAIVRTIQYAIERQRLSSSLKKTQVELRRALEESDIRKTEIRALLRGARAVLEQTDFNTTARKVFDICSEVIGSTSGYVALLSEDGAENEVLFLEAGDRPCTVDPELPMPIRGLRETSYRTNTTVYENDFMNSEWIEFMPEGHVRLENVMFAPLNIDRKTVGIIGLANKTGGFTDNDAKIASGFGELAAIALQNSRNADKRNIAEKQNIELIKELQAALANVKKLSGLLPICSHCKKIRDDQGYWKQIELYIDEHSEARFSHSICQECAAKYYPDMNPYDD